MQLHAHYIDGAVTRRVRTRRVIDKVGPAAVLRVVRDQPAAAAANAAAPRKPTRRGSRVAAESNATGSAVHASSAVTGGTAAAIAQPTSEGAIVGNG
jgi:hypothetical protein